MHRQLTTTPRARHLRSAWHVRAVSGWGLVGLLVLLVAVGAVSANGGGPAVDWWVISGGGAP